MVVRQAVSYAVRRSFGMVVHPRRTAGELVSDAGQVVGAGLGMAGQIAGSVSRAAHSGMSNEASVEELLREAGPDVPPRPRTSARTAPPAEAEAEAAEPEAPEPEGADPEALLDRPGPVPESIRAEAATPAPKPAPPKKRPRARKVAEEVTTPSGIPAADVGFNPATGEDADLLQPGTEPLMDPSLTKSVAAEAAIMKKASSTRKK